MENTAKRLGAPVPIEAGKMFDAAAKGEWDSASNHFYKATLVCRPGEQRQAINRFPPAAWQPLQEAGGFCELLDSMDGRYSALILPKSFTTMRCS